MPERSADWFRQAEKDLENARWEIKGGFFEWACFSAQQAAEKALKAVYQKLGGMAWGHSVRDFGRESGIPPRLLYGRGGLRCRPWCRKDPTVL